MKTLLTLIILVTACFSFHAQNVAINDDGAAPDASAILDLQSASKGLLLPRMTTLQRNSIEGPGIGLMVYDTEMGKFYCYSGSAWVQVMSGFVTVLKDADGDTKVQVEESPDEDKIRFDVGGTERWVMDGKSLAPVNSGGSLFIGMASGEFDDGSNNSNVFVGDSSGHDNTSGYHNTGVGFASLESNTSGYWNTAMGNSAMHDNTIGIHNVGIGYGSLRLNTEGSYNTATGGTSLYYNTIGDNNSAYGSFALRGNTNGNSNTAIGYAAMYHNESGSYNTVCGFRALYNNVSGGLNTAIGLNALYENTTGPDNTALGAYTLYYNTTGWANTAVGVLALNDNVSGERNTALGRHALVDNTTGSFNTAAGTEALESNTEGFSNSALGFDALSANTLGDYNTAIGRAAMLNNVTGTYCTGVGYSANSVGVSYLNTTGLGRDADPTAANRVRIGNSSVSQIGGQVDWSTLSDAKFKTEIREDVVGLDFIKRLRPVTYHYDLDAIDDWYALHYNERDSSDYPEKYEIESTEFSGFLAQEVEQAARDAGFDFSGVCAPAHEDDFYSLRYGTFVVPLVKAVQELSVQNDQLRQLYMEQQEVMILLMKDIEKLKSGAFKMMK